jgi:RNase H-like domain found in reverse transcriptase/Reverse transcriptase (RNA-dependent DNA polymerase)/gag-polyprotein putative aspartyl protease
MLDIRGDDLYDAHTVIRHLQEVQTGDHVVTLMLPLDIRKHRAFTPWLVNGKTQARLRRMKMHQNLGKELPSSVCILEISNPVKHVHSQGGSSPHFASFDMRVAGSQIRTLLDTGATCTCMSSRFAKKLGLHWELDKVHQEIGGIGGEVSVLGTLHSTVKAGKHHMNQKFVVVEEPIAGYDCVLGQDFLRATSSGIFFTPLAVHFAIGCTDKSMGQVVFTRRLEEGLAMECRRSQCSLSMVLQLDRLELDVQPTSNNEYKRLLREVTKGQAVGYTLVIREAQPDQSEPIEALPPKVQAVIDKHSRPGGTLGGTIPDHTHARHYRCHIELHDGVKPVNIRQYRLTPKEKDELEEKVNSFIKKGWIEPSQSPWCSSVLFVPKPNNKLRFCVDFRALNRSTVLDGGPIPNQGELLDSLKGANLFSALDLASGYYQIELDEESRPYTAFPTPYGLYQWKVMPMGLTNAPAIFQRAMNEILHEHIKAKYCKVYLDDIIILSTSVEEHAKHLDAVLEDLHKYNLFCQLPKCVWAKKQLQYLGHLVDGEGVRPDPAKVEALQTWEPPYALIEKIELDAASALAKSSAKKQLQHECRRFLGFMNYFNRFIPRYSEVAVPLTDQTKDDAPRWTDACTHAWITMRKLLATAAMMYHPDPAQPFHVYSDASIRAIGGMLVQYIEGKVYPIAFTARKLVPAEVNYTTTEQEMLAVVYCLAQWRYYLEGPVVLLHTDHEPLTWLKSQKSLNRRQARWLEFLSRFSYEVVYVKGDENVVADALTRNLDVYDGKAVDLPCENWPDLALAIRVCRAASQASSNQRARCTRIADGHRANSPRQGAYHLRGLSPSAGCGRDSRRTSGSVLAGSHQEVREVLAVLASIAAGGHTRARARDAGAANRPSKRCSRGESRTDIDRHTSGGTGSGDDLPMHSATDAMPDTSRLLEVTRKKGMKRNRTLADREGDISPTCNSGMRTNKRIEAEAGTQTAKGTRSVHWGPDVVYEVATRRGDRDAGESLRTGFGECKGNHEGGLIPSLRSSRSPCHTVVGPDQPTVPGSDAGPDQSLSTYEKLLEELFTRIRDGVTQCTETKSEEQRKDGASQNETDCFGKI